MMNYTSSLVEQFRFLILLTTITTLLPYLFSTAAYVMIVLEKKYLHTNGLVQTIILSSLAFAYSLWAVAGSGQETVYWGFILMMAGIPFYVWIKLRNKNHSPNKD